MTTSTSAVGPDSDVRARVHAIAKAAQDAQPALAAANRASKDAVLRDMADQLVADTDLILAANERDLVQADSAGIDPGLRDRLALDSERVAAIADQLRTAAGLADPVGQVVRGNVLENGLQLTQVRVPLGVVGMIYEARPNVTVDAAGLALKAGNAVVLRGGSAALHSNQALIASMHRSLERCGFPSALIGGIDQFGRDGAGVLMQARGLIDVLIPRGGAGLIQRVVRESQVPVIETGTGNTHIFVDSTADLDAAIDIVVNAKTQRIGVCNALENLLVHTDVAQQFLPRVARVLGERGVTLHADDDALPFVEGQGASTVAATARDFHTEYLSLDLAVAVVPDVEAAIRYIREHTSGHTESILTNSVESERAFVSGVDSAVVMVNASTRFSDGGGFGFGAEIGISTQKLHARGPMALPELTSTKWIVRGTGHVR